MVDPIFHSGHIKAVSVIASFASDGEVHPLYVRINDNSIKIYDTVVVNENLAYIDFTCNIVTGNLLEQLHLMYHKHEHAWFIRIK